MTKLLVILSILASSTSFAFPGMIRHGYVNCTTCHVSPSGGGILTEYGHELSAEVLSTWSKDGEEKFLYGSVAKHLSKDLLLGGDTRVIQTYQDNPMFTEKRFFLMQADLEGAYKMGKLTIDLEAGYLDSDTFQSLRHFFLYQFNDVDALRLGKFKNNYGINTDEHMLSIKSNLGWNDETETYNLEYSRLTGKYSIFATAIFGAPESISQKRNLTVGEIGVVDHGGSLRASFSVAEKYEFGVSYFYGKKAFEDWRSVAGPFVILGFTPNFFYMGELDFQAQNGTGVYDYQRLTYEPIQGLQCYVTQEIAHPNNGDTAMQLSRYGLGVQFFPRPHSEIHAQWKWEEDVYDESQYHPVASLLWHYYL